MYSIIINQLICAVVLCTVLINTYGEVNYESNGGQYIAVMTSGDVDDFGYNYIINAGRVKMEQRLNMSNTLWIPNVKDPKKCETVITQLVQNNYRLIISGTFVHRTPLMAAALKYTNITFVAYIITPSDIPNLSAGAFLNAELWWAAGVFASITSLNNKVGFIHPGTTEGSIQSINAFYSGAKWANSSIEVYTMYTGAFVAVDRAQGACDVLLNEIGVGALTGQQDDLTVPRAAMASGKLAIGVTGFPLKELYGEAVGISFIRDWTDILTFYAQNSLTAGQPFKAYRAGSFNNTGQSLDKPSHLVTAEQWQVMQNAIKAIQKKGTTFLCGDYLNKFDNFNTSTGCLNAQAGNFNNKVYEDIHQLGYYIMPIENFPFPKVSRIGIITVASILAVIPVALIIFTFVMRKHPQIQSGSPFFFWVMLVGSLLVYAGIIVWPLEPSFARCNARIWLPSLGATIAVSALITKNVRIFLLFFNPFLFKGKRLATIYYTPLVMITVAIDIVLLVLFTALGRSSDLIEQGINGLGTYETRHVCSTSKAGNAIVLAILVWHMVQLIVGCVISFMLRNVTEKQYNERKSVAVAIYIVTFCLVIVSVLIGVTTLSNVQLIVFISVALIIANTAVLVIVFGSRVVNIFMQPVEQIIIPQVKISGGGSATIYSRDAKSNKQHSGGGDSGSGSHGERNSPTQQRSDGLQIHYGGAPASPPYGDSASPPSPLSHPLSSPNDEDTSSSV